MSATALYRLCIWLPLVVPAAAIGVARALDVGLADVLLVEMLAYSVLYGGVPYAALAAWATWWVGGRTEDEIRRLMFRAPLLMAGVFAPLALVLGIAVGAPSPFAAVAALGCVVILLLGYCYVGLTLLLRWSLRARLA